MTRLAERLVEAHHVDAAEFAHLMTVGVASATSSRAPGAPPRWPDFSKAIRRLVEMGLEAAKQERKRR